MYISRAVTAVLSCLLFGGTTVNANTDTTPIYDSSLQNADTTAMSETRRLSVTYDLMQVLDVGSNTCAGNRESQISSDKRLASPTCLRYGYREIEVYEFNASTSQYNAEPIFTTSGCTAFQGFGFSGDGKTIVCPTGARNRCRVSIYIEYSTGVWTRTDIPVFSCASQNNAAYVQMGVSYDGTSFIIGGGSFTGSSNVANHGIVQVFKKNPDGTWVNTYEYIGTNFKGQVGFTSVMSDDGKRFVYNDGTDNHGMDVFLKYVEQNDDGSWGNPILMPMEIAYAYFVKAFFTPDGSRLAVTLSVGGLIVFDYDSTVVGGGWTEVVKFSDSKYDYQESGMTAISDDGRRIIFCGQQMNGIATINQGDDGTWTESIWGNQVYNGGCTIDGSGGIMVTSDRSGVLRAYRDETIEFVPLTDSPSLAPSPPPTPASSTQPSSALSFKPSLLPTEIPSLQPSLMRPSQFSWIVSLQENGGIVLNQSLLKISYNISNRDYSYNIYDEDCNTTVVDNPFVITDATVTGVGNGFKIVDNFFEIDIPSLESSSVWSSNSIGGVLQFCGIMSLYTNSTGEVEVLRNEAIFIINVANKSNFTATTIETMSRDPTDGGTRYIAVESPIDAYMCGDNFEKSSATLSQGDFLQVCTKATNGIVETKQIEELLLVQNRNDGDKLSEQIVGSEGDYFKYPSLTLSGCNEGSGISKICYVKFQLTAGFFKDKNPNSITVTGVVKLENMGSNRHLKERRGLDSYSTRNGEQSLDGGFRLIIDLKNGDNTSRSRRNDYPIIITIISIGMGMSW